MIQGQYISFEVAKLLRKKGFVQDGMWFYYEPTKELTDSYYPAEDELFFAAPTQSLTMRWLREEHNLFIEIQCYGCEADKEAHYEFSYVISEFVLIDNKICTTLGLEEKKAKSRFNSYEEACEAAIEYCLENLI